MSSVVIDVSVGINKYFLPTPKKIKKGSMILLEYTTSARIGLKNDGLNNGYILYSDFLITGTGPFSLTRITPNMNSRVLINSLVDTSFYKTCLSLLNSYSFFVTYQLTARMSNSSMFLNATINLKNSKLNCFLFSKLTLRLQAFIYRIIILKQLYVSK